MSRFKLKSRDKTVRKMSRDGLLVKNKATGETTRVSKREAAFDIRAENPKQKQGLLARPKTKMGVKSENRPPDARKKAARRKPVRSSIAAEKPHNIPNSAPIQPNADSELKISEPAKTVQVENGVKSPIKRRKNERGNNTPEIPLRHSPALPAKAQDSPNQSNEQKKKFKVQRKAALKIPEPAKAEKEVKSPVLQHKSKSVSDVPKQEIVSQAVAKSLGKPNKRRQTTYRQSKPTKIQYRPQKPAFMPVNERGAAQAITEAAYMKPAAANTGKYKARKRTALKAGKPAKEAKRPVLRHKSDEAPMQKTAAPSHNPGSPMKKRSGKFRIQRDIPYRQSRQNQSAALVPVGDKSVAPVANKQVAAQTKSPGTATVPSSGGKSAVAPAKDNAGRPKFDDGADMPKNPKLIKAEMQANRADASLEKARGKLPTKRRLKSGRVFDETAGKARQRIYFDKEVKPQGEHLRGALPLRPLKFAANAAILNAHRKLYQAEHENVGVKAAHRTEMAAEGGIRTALRYRKTAPYRRVAKLEKVAAKKNINLIYTKSLARNPNLNSNVMSRFMQKRKVKQQYAKAAREAKRAGKTAQATTRLTAKAAKSVVMAAKAILANPKVLVILAIIAVVVMITMSLFSLFGSIGSGGLSAIIAATYLAEDGEIDAVVLAYSEWEVDLRLEILNVESSHPGFDEYRFNIGSIGHCPLELMAYLTAVFQDFAFAEVEEILREIFEEQYTLELVPEVEIRTRVEMVGGYAVTVEYEWHILNVTLEVTPLAEVLASRMTLEQAQHFDILMQSMGARQLVGSPFDFDWLPFVSSHYGWRVHPISGEKNLHRGIDIALPTGTPIRAAHDGTVIFAGYMGSFGNVVMIAGDNGVETRYAHCDTILVSVGQTVSMGDIIATVGSTGNSTAPHLHFEILVENQHRNPLFWAQTN